jgi:ankyrin repeat protein
MRLSALKIALLILLASVGLLGLVFKQSCLNGLLLFGSALDSSLSVELALKAGANVHVNSDQPLGLAAFHGQTEIVKILLDDGADIHAENDAALYLAASRGHLSTASYLFTRGARVPSACSLKAILKDIPAGRPDLVNLIKSHAEHEGCHEKLVPVSKP